MADAARDGMPDWGAAEVQARFAELYRYAQVGRCVSAVTHDVNNMLGAALAYAELVGLEKNLSENARRMLGEIMDAAGKCSRLVNGLTAIARPDRASVTAVEPGEIVAEVLALRQYELRLASIAVEVEAEPGLPVLALDLPKIEYVLLYLLMNAQEALAEAPAPRSLRIRASLHEGGVRIALRDSAGPIGEAVRARLFEPFHTTRGGVHFGFGLAAARALAEAQGGTLDYDPAEGFRLWLPCGLARG